jgi:putative two-component system response regulator
MKAVAPDLILSDISMPEMDGFAFYDAVRAIPESIAIPFIFLTARGDRTDVFASKKMGAEDYLIKPIERDMLITALRSRLDRSQQLMLAQLRQAYEASLIMLANAIELRDKYTRGHIERVMVMALKIAQQLGVSEPLMEDLRFGAILHDVGKISISDTVLRKAGPLTIDEWNEMKRHAEIGAELLKRVPYLANAIPIIRSHHERWDGRGYPDGLAGEAIPLGARIVAVADAYDAMTTERVYHGGDSPDQAVNEIRSGCGIRYDPTIVAAFLAALGLDE